MSFERIRIFLRVAERGSFTAAATQLGLPLTSVSRRVSELEESLGVRLLNRTTRRVSLTEAGREYYERCILASEMLDEADRVVRALRTEPEGTLRILTPYAPGLIVLEPALIEFRRQYPKVQLHLTYDNKPLDLVEHGFDVALRTGPLADSGYSARRLGWSRAQLAASPSYLERVGRPESPYDLPKHSLLVIGETAPLTTWRLINETGVTANVIVRPVLISNESATIMRQAVSGAGIALISRQLMAHRLAEGALETVLPQWHRSNDVEISVLFPKKATLDRKVRAFIDFAAGVFAPWMVEKNAGDVRDVTQGEPSL